jgi:uncharacterized protein YprB with RNaseH-like and TPR domain
MLDNIREEDILFLDIETVPILESFDMLDPAMQARWEKKSKQLKGPEQSSSDLYEKAGMYAEFGKIICISAGLITEKNPYHFRLKSFYGDDERALLSGFSEMLARFSKSGREALLCAHNGKEFDFPFIARRMIINRLTIPPLLDNAGKKPWEVKHLDTMELWKFGDFKSYTSLDLLTSVLGIPSPKDDIDGSMVAGIYYQAKDIERIVRYCERDVLAIGQVILRFMNMPLITEENIESVTFH